MKVAIMQPTYLPWIGYFDLLHRVDKFVLLDDVEFSRQSWQQRNRIKGPEGLQWLTVPVRCRGRSKQKLCEVEIADPRFTKKHLKSLRLHYRKSPFFDEYFGGVESILERGITGLAQLNSELILWLASRLGIETPIETSSSLAVSGARGERVADICATLGADQYISPMGAAEYMSADMHAFIGRDIQVRFHDYEHPAYKQRYTPFLAFACALDLLFNHGPDALAILSGGFRGFQRPESVALALSAQSRANHRLRAQNSDYASDSSKR